MLGDVVNWNIREVDGELIRSLSRDLNVLALTARCLLGRGISTAKDARFHLEPSLTGLRRPDGLAGLEAAVKRLVKAITGGERIGCFGDYDVDGVTTTALLASMLRAFGATCEVRVAQRDAGYGFGPTDVQYFADAKCSLIITGDCGTSDRKAILAAKQGHMDVIVVDHHTVPPANSEPHPAVALVNPFRDDSTFPFRGMASVGLAFYVMASVRTGLRDVGYFKTRKEPDMRQVLDLVAVGTVADLVPLQGENRILTWLGLRQLARRQRPGFAALLANAGVLPLQSIDEDTIGWKLGPRINAPGRLGDAAPSLRLLLSESTATAKEFAQALEQANTERRAEQKRVVEQAFESLGDMDPGPCVVVAGQGWKSGIVGIVASRLVEHFERPAFVIAIDEETGLGRGSARSVPGVNLYEALAACQEQLIRFGGHAAAAGFTVDGARVEHLRQALWSQVAASAPASAGFCREVDAEVSFDQITERLVRELRALGPFGKGNECPLFACLGAVVRESSCVGDGSHLRLKLQDISGTTHPAIGFGLGDKDPGTGATVDVLFVPTMNEWNGRQDLQLEIRHIQPATPAA